MGPGVITCLFSFWLTWGQMGPPVAGGLRRVSFGLLCPLLIDVNKLAVGTPEATVVPQNVTVMLKKKKCSALPAKRFPSSRGLTVWDSGSASLELLATLLCPHSQASVPFWVPLLRHGPPAPVIKDPSLPALYSLAPSPSLLATWMHQLRRPVTKKRQVSSEGLKYPNPD